MSATGKGFTLIELLVVLAILTLLVSALPSAVNAAFPGRRLAVTAEDVAAQLREVRSQATRTAVEQVLIVDTHASVNLPGVRLQLPDVIEATWEPASGLSAPVGPVFFADASATPGRIQVRLGSREREIRIAGLSGRVEVLP